MRKAYDEELKMIKEEVVLMSSQAENMVNDSIFSLVNKDVKLAKNIIHRDNIVDLKEVQLMQIVSEVIARQQPVARDLRSLASTFKIISNIERIADSAVNIAQRTILLYEEDYFKILDHIPRMGVIVEEQLKTCIDAYVNLNLSQMEDIIAKENEIDDLNEKVFRECNDAIITNKASSYQGITLTYIGNCLERIGDHATNIFESVYFIKNAHFIDFNDLDLASE